MACNKVKNIEELFDGDHEHIISGIITNLLDNNIENEEDYRNKLHIFIDEYTSNNPYLAKELVNDYDVFRSIKLSRENYGEFEVQEGKIKNYMMLGYVLIDEYFKEYYGFKELVKLKEMVDKDREDEEESCL